ncbi:hypothetical protein F5883DRAFT_559869 [Diaporthe sp. PMI_573]|nr:hypothetical protein F5883DRAFT_559869 [Diaporthaceae sp. PMI_573]
MSRTYTSDTSGNWVDQGTRGCISPSWLPSSPALNRANPCYQPTSWTTIHQRLAHQGPHPFSFCLNGQQRCLAPPRFSSILPTASFFPASFLLIFPSFVLILSPSSSYISIPVLSRILLNLVPDITATHTSARLLDNRSTQEVVTIFCGPSSKQLQDLGIF